MFTFLKKKRVIIRAWWSRPFISILGSRGRRISVPGQQGHKVTLPLKNIKKGISVFKSIESECFFFFFFKGGCPKSTKILAGDRPDNHWLHYDSKNIPRTKKEWESSCFVEKTHWGYYNWPK